VFDFGRSTEGEGTYKFKKQWGAKPQPLTWYESIDCKHVAKKGMCKANSQRESAAILWKKQPLWLANMIGPHLRKYISL
jgi:hypothetical protein